MIDAGLIPNRLLTIKEVAQILCVNERTVRRYADAGALHVIRKGTRLVRISPNELKQFIVTGMSV